MKVSDMVVRVSLIDEATPALKRLQRRLWWYQHGEALMRAVTVLLAIGAFLLGRVTA